MVKGTKQHVAAWLKRLAVLAAVPWALPAGAVPARSAIDGTWRIAQPMAAFRPTDGKPIPFTPEGRKQYELNVAAAAKRDFSFDPTTMTCSSPGLPRMMLTGKRLHILSRPDVVTVMFEWNRLARQINMRDPMSEPDFGTMMGQAWGRWQGDTLVVQSKGYSHKKLLDSLIPNSDDLQLSERIRPVGKTMLEDRITITDPAIFTRPWETLVTYVRQPDAVFPEDVCLDRRAAGQPPIER